MTNYTSIISYCSRLPSFAMLCESVVDTTISIKVIEAQHTLRSLNKRRIIQFDSSFQQWAMLPLIADPLKELEAV